MNVQIEQLPACQTKITFHFDATDVDAAYDRVYKEFAKHGRIPGFRPGKAPRAIIRRHVGADALREGAFGELIREPLEKALDDIDVVEAPQVPDPEEVGLQEGQPLELVLTAVSGPRVKLPDLADIELLEPYAEITEEDIDKVLNDLRETFAQERGTERQEVQTGDAVDLALKVTITGEEAPADEIEQTIVVGRGQHFPDIDGELVGKTVGSVVEVDVTYPQDYHDESLAGKSAKIAATIKALRERVLPELDDELAKKMDAERFTTLDDLRNEIRRQLEEGAAKYAREELENQINKALLEKSEIEVPEVLVERAYKSKVESLIEDFRAGGLSLDDIRELTNVSDDEYAAIQRRRARRVVKLHAVMTELARDLGDPSEEDIAAEAEPFAREHNLDLALVKQALPLQDALRQRLTNRVLQRRIYDAIIAKADLQKIPVEEYRSKRQELLKLEDADEEPKAEAAEAAEVTEATETPVAAEEQDS